MINYISNQLLKKKDLLLFFLIGYSLFITEKTLAKWDNRCCIVAYIPHHAADQITPNYINLHFKFFEYEPELGYDNSYFEYFEAYYSTDEGKNFTCLFIATTKNQDSRTWAWIDLKYKQKNANIDILYVPINNLQPVTKHWTNAYNPRLYVRNTFLLYKNETWLWLDWILGEDQNNITHVVIKGKWHNPGVMRNEIVNLVFKIKPRKAMLNTNNIKSINSLPKQEIVTENKRNTIKACNEGNEIAINGALREKIQVYTTSGKLVKSIVADKDVVKIKLSVKQVYIVYIGNIPYKLAL